MVSLYTFSSFAIQIAGAHIGDEEDGNAAAAAA